MDGASVRGVFSYNISARETTNLLSVLLDSDLIAGIIEQEEKFHDSMESL